MSKDELRRRRLHLELDEQVEHACERARDGTVTLSIQIRGGDIASWSIVTEEQARPWRPIANRKPLTSRR